MIPEEKRTEILQRAEALALRQMQEQAYEIADMGFLNDTMTAYCFIAIEKAELDEKARNKVLRKLTEAFDDYSAQEALQYYLNGGTKR